MAAAPVWTTGARPVTVVPLSPETLAGVVLTASPVEAEPICDAGAGLEHAARVAARTITARCIRAIVSNFAKT